jgi:uncharacterized protein YraI
MQRKSLALVAIAVTLFAVFMLQLTVAQAATSQQATEPPADEPVMLEQPIRIRIRQAIPFTITLAPTTEMTATAGLTDTAALLATDELTDTATLTETDALTETAATEAVATEVAAEESGDVAADTVDATTATLTATAELSAPVVVTRVPVTLAIDFDFVVTQTLTTTVPASVTLQLPDFQTRTLPIAIVIAPLADGEAVVEIVLPETVDTPEITATEVTATEAVTTEATTAATDVTTPTVAATLAPEINNIPLINATANTTANLRAGPGTTFTVVGQANPGQALQIAAVNEDGGWYLLGGNNWIASTLITEQLTNVPVVNDQILQALQGAAPTEAVTPTEAATPEAPAAPTTVVTPTVTTDANLRAGPGTEFDILGGTVTGQAINIVGRNADGTWFRLDNGGWVFATLVANPPAQESIPVVSNDGSPAAPDATPAPATGLGGLLPTPTPAAPTTPVTTTTSATPAAELTEYLAAASELVGQFDQARNGVDGLLAEVAGNPALITDSGWTTRMNAALRLLSQTSASVGELTVPAAAAAVHQQLEDTAISYAEAAAALTQAVQKGDVALLDEADALISAAAASHTAAETAIIQANEQ